ncbi:type VI secretion system contractile sheath small subunit [Desulfovibrio piger]|nr:type VI secretion system contractile sheath small subunit [Desulfovibrio piger]
MAKETSLAPKERINVTFRPATGGAQEEIELPLKVMVVGDFLQRYDDRPLIDRKPVSVNKNNFADVMAKQNLTVQLAVRNRLTDKEDPDDLPVKLSFQNLRDFEPEGVARQIPEMNNLLKLRDALISLKGPLGNIPAFRAALDEVLHDEERRRQIMEELRISDKGSSGEQDGNEDAPSDEQDK